MVRRMDERMGTGRLRYGERERCSGGENKGRKGTRGKNNVPGEEIGVREDLRERGKKGNGDENKV